MHYWMRTQECIVTTRMLTNNLGSELYEPWTGRLFTCLSIAMEWDFTGRGT
jgi:hypothetical protein